MLPCGRAPPAPRSRSSSVVLTTTHLDQTPENCDSANLKAMCRGCHLHHDQDHHARPRAEAHHTALEVAGQMTFEL
jgi:hypothetical protein